MHVSMPTNLFIGYHEFLSGNALIWRPCHSFSSKLLLSEIRYSTEERLRLIQEVFNNHTHCSLYSAMNCKLGLRRSVGRLWHHFFFRESTLPPPPHHLRRTTLTQELIHRQDGGTLQCSADCAGLAPCLIDTRASSTRDRKPSADSPDPRLKTHPAHRRCARVHRRRHRQAAYPS